MNEEEINLLAKELAEITLTDAIEFEYEDMLDAMYAEHLQMQYAAHSFDLDAQAYGGM